MDITCHRCGVTGPFVELRPELGIGECSSCKALLDVRGIARPAAVGESSRPTRIRAEVALPRQIRLIHAEPAREGRPGKLELTRASWATWQAIPIVVTLVCLAAFAWAWLARIQLAPRFADAFHVGLLIANLLLLGYLALIVKVLRTRLLVRVDASELLVELGRQRKRFALADIEQVYSFADAEQRMFAVALRLRPGAKPLELVPAPAPAQPQGHANVAIELLASPEQALYIEQQLERAIGLVDAEVDGELDRSLPASQLSRPSRLRYRILATMQPVIFTALTLVLMQNCRVPIAVAPLQPNAVVELPLELEPGTLQLAIDVVLAGRWVEGRGSKSRRAAQLPRVLALEFELIRAGQIEQRLRCDPFELGVFGSELNWPNTWSFDAVLADCEFVVEQAGPVTLRVRRIELEPSPELVIEQLSVEVRR